MESRNFKNFYRNSHASLKILLNGQSIQHGKQSKSAHQNELTFCPPIFFLLSNAFPILKLFFRNLDTLCWKVGVKVQGEWIGKTSGSASSFRAWSLRESRAEAMDPASLEKAAGWVGRVSARSGVTGTKDRGLCFPRSSLSTPVLPRLPKCRSARACAAEHKHSHTRTGACAKALRQPRQAARPLCGPRHPGL